MKLSKVELLFIIVATLILNLVYVLPVEAATFKFPWQSGQSWNWTSDWQHDTPIAIDLAPSLAANSNKKVLAAVSGDITYICTTGAYSKNIKVRLADNSYTEYWHIGKNTLPANIFEGASIVTGQLLGETAGGWANSDGCGKSTGHHVHWIVSAGAHTVQEWNFTVGINEFVKTDQPSVKKYLGDWLLSTNTLNFGQESGCGSPVTVLINHVFPQSNWLDTCYGSSSITTIGNTTVTNGAKQEFVSDNIITFTDGFVATANSTTEMRARIL